MVGPDAAGDHAAAVDVQDAREQAGALGTGGPVDPYGHVRSVGRAGHGEVFVLHAVVGRQCRESRPVHLLVQLALARDVEVDQAARSGQLVKGLQALTDLWVDAVGDAGVGHVSAFPSGAGVAVT